MELLKSLSEVKANGDPASAEDHPGLKFDRKIEEKLFKKKVCQCESPQLSFGHREFCFSCQAATPRPFSTDLSVAWRVVEEIGGEFQLSNKDSTYWGAYFRRDIKPDFFGQGYSLN